jgi:hypothetical protein
MRPKKPVFLYCADRELLSTTAFALRLHPYQVTAIADSIEGSVVAGDRCAAFSCVVLIHAEQADRAGDLAPVRYADVVLYGRNTTMEHILASLQMLCRSRSGPKAQSAA